MDVNTKTLQALQAGLKFREMRQEIISSNIANADTPGYKAKRLDFEMALARALDVDGELTMKVNGDKHFNVGGGGFNNLEPERSGSDCRICCLDYIVIRSPSATIIT